MGAEENKKVVLGMLEAMTAGNMSAVSNALADSATWWVAGSFPLSGTMTKAKFCELFGNVGASTENGLRLTPKGITAEGDRVAVEAESYAKLRNAGPTRTNITCFSSSVTVKFSRYGNTWTRCTRIRCSVPDLLRS
jgi:ketosteroid isomerase-like protein